MIERMLLALIGVYRFAVAPFTGNQCRFSPTCSCYAKQAIERHGAAAGVCLAALRVLSCHPWTGRAWLDPVPERFAWGDLFRYKDARHPETSPHKDRPSP